MEATIFLCNNPTPREKGTEEATQTSPIRVTSDSSQEVVAETGGGPNGAAIGPDGMAYLCNNGGLEWVEVDGTILPSGGLPAGYTSGSI